MSDQEDAQEVLGAMIGQWEVVVLPDRAPVHPEHMFWVRGNSVASIYKLSSDPTDAPWIVRFWSTSGVHRAPSVDTFRSLLEAKQHVVATLIAWGACE